MNSQTADLLNWINHVYEAEKRPDSRSTIWLRNSLSALAVGIGAASTYILYVLGSEFGESISDYPGVDYLFGLTAACPMAALAALNAKDATTSAINYFFKSHAKPATLFKKKSYSELITSNTANS
jgi:hypothetical protein